MIGYPIGIFFGVMIAFAVRRVVDRIVQRIMLERISRDECGWCGASVGVPHRKGCTHPWEHTVFPSGPLYTSDDFRDEP